MDHRVSEMRHMMEQLMLHFCSNGMPLCHRQLRTHGNVEFGMEPMPHPPDADLGDLVHLWCVPGRVVDFFKHRGLDTVEQTRENCSTRLPANPYNGESNHEPDNRVGDRVPAP